MSRFVLIIFLLALGLTLMTAGILQFTTIYHAYRVDDILRTETPHTFKVWLAGLAQQASAHADDVEGPTISQRVADRLELMSLPMRRRVIINMARSQFWSDIALSSSTPHAIKSDVLNGVILALQSEPCAGDLYFAAAWMETTLDSFGARPRRMLEASYTFSPHEFELIVERLIFAPLIWDKLNAEERAKLRRDLDYVREGYPHEANQIVNELEAQGVKFD